MPIPTIHLNGTAGEVLLDQYTSAARAVQQAIDAVCDAGPNARDYYVQGTDAALAAQREHEARVVLLKRVRDELAAIAEGVQDQIDAKEASRRSRLVPGTKDR
jgi:hypothetical protein